MSSPTCTYFRTGKCTMKQRCKWQSANDGEACNLGGALESDALSDRNDVAYQFGREDHEKRATRRRNP